MKKFGVGKVTQHFRKKNVEEEDEEQEKPQTTKYVMDDIDVNDTEQIKEAQEVVRVLYKRYDNQIQRYIDYRNLFMFLGFMAWFLATLYLQRTADVAYQVHSTMLSVLDPGTEQMGGVNEVYDYLNNVLQTVWSDPVCGDGVCDEPFEYAAYGRFGCRADCGQLAQLQKLTRLQLDLYYDFSHPLGSIPASDLMQQAKWNLCPQNTQYSRDCYYDTDQGFTQVRGQISISVSDAPDGDWDLVVKRDIFNKIRGAVRDFKLLYTSGMYYKVLIAALAAQAEQNFEMTLLRQAINVSSQPLWMYISNTMAAMNDPQAAFKLEQMQNAVCLCYDVNVPNNASLTFTYNTSVLLPFNQSVDPMSPDMLMTQDWNTYRDTYCNPSMQPANMFPVNQTWNGTQIYGPVANGTNFTTLTNVTQPVTTTNATAMGQWCSTWLNSTMSWRTNMTRTVQMALVDRRLGDQRTTGKIAQRNAVTNGLYQYLILNYPELLNPIYTVPRGTQALDDPINAQLSVLAQLYVDGLKYSTEPAPRALNLTRARVYNPNITLPVLAERANLRLMEVQEQQKDTHSINVIGPEFNFTVADILAAFNNASIKPAANIVPQADDAGLGKFRVPYNLVFFPGNTSAYMLCNMETRAPDYIGNCTDMSVTCFSQASNSSNPYVCLDLNNNNATVPGNMSDTTYRERCQIPCDAQLDANSVCECYGTCGRSQFCECESYHTVFKPDAMDNAEFIDIQDAVRGLASASIVQNLAKTGVSSFRRSLKQATTDSVNTQIAGVRTEVDTIRTKAGTVASQMSSLQVKVDTANSLAIARANDQALIDLINQGRAEIASGQQRIESYLDTIISKQRAALDAANAAAAALENIQNLAAQQAAAASALQKAVETQLQAIKVASAQGVISMPQALALWIRARRDKAASEKAFRMANVVCNYAPTKDNIFTLDNHNEPMASIPRVRMVGTTNRVIGGMMLHQFRTNDTLCAPSRFSGIQNKCSGHRDTHPFGIDPVFKSGTTLYNPDFEDFDGSILTSFYNCSALDKATYNFTSPINGLLLNPEPFCAELYNPNSLPYAFQPFPLSGKPDGFPVWVDINLDNNGVTNWATYLQEGLFLDTHTQGLSMELITYNAPLKVFGFLNLRFKFKPGGSIDVKYNLYTTRIELYDTYEDGVRFFMEIITSMMIITLCLIQLYGCIMAQIRQRNFLKFFASGSARYDLVSNALLISCIIIWWQWVDGHSKTFNIKLRYDVYETLNPGANFLALNEDGLHLTRAWEAFASMGRLIGVLDWYYTLNGISILLLIGRALRLMDFQPRLGVVTRSLWLAGPDLIHFAIVAGVVFIGYATMAHLIFGNSIAVFSTFGESINTCFVILLGVIDVQADMRALGGLQTTAGGIFFWTYELLVFMVLLNFLLAIIVDAFSEVKENTKEVDGLHTELYNMAADTTRSIWASIKGHHVTDRQLAKVLREWAGDEEEQEQEEEKEGTKYLVVNENNLSYDTVLKVLQKCLADTTTRDSEVSSGGWGRLQRGTKRLTEGELKMAADYIIDRFGEMPEKVDDESEAKPEFTSEAEMLDKERDQLASALERLADVQRDLADGQRNLMGGQKHLADQQSRLISALGGSK